MPRRYQPPARRRKKKRSQPSMPVAPRLVFPPAEPPAAEVPEPPRAPRTAGTETIAGKHVARDYSYVIVELKRVALVIAFIIAGLFVAAASLRWF